MFNYGFNFGSKLGGLRPLCFDGVLLWIKGIVENDIYCRDSAPDLGVFDMLMSKGPCLTLNGTDESFTWSEPITIISTEGTSVIASDGTGTPTAGTLYNIVLDTGSVISCSEVNGITVYSDNYLEDGIYGTINTSNIATVRAGRQDTFFHQNTVGWWEKVADNTYYPYPISGYSEYHKSNTFNEAITTYSFSVVGTPAPSAIVTMDATHQLFTDGSGDSVGVTQTEILSGCNTNDQYIFGSISPKPKELWCFNSVQTGLCLENSLVRAGIGEWLTDEYTGEYVYDEYTGEKIYVEL